MTYAHIRFEVRNGLGDVVAGDLRSESLARHAARRLADAAIYRVERSGNLIRERRVTESRTA